MYVAKNKYELNDSIFPFLPRQEPTEGEFFSVANTEIIENKSPNDLDIVS